MAEYGWDLDGGGGGKKADFTKFPVGTTRIRVLDPLPLIRWTHWMSKHKRSINCPGFKTCPIDDIIEKQKANGEKASYNRSKRYAVNIFNYETGKVEIMEQGKTFFEDLKLVLADAKDAGVELSDWVLKVRRVGTGKDDTKYRIDKLEDAEGKIPTEEMIDLKEFFKPHTPEQITRILNGEDWNDVMGSKNDSDDETTDDDLVFDATDDEEFDIK